MSVFHPITLPALTYRFPLVASRRGRDRVLDITLVDYCRLLWIVREMEESPSSRLVATVTTPAETIEPLVSSWFHGTGDPRLVADAIEESLGLADDVDRAQWLLRLLRGDEAWEECLGSIIADIESRRSELIRDGRIPMVLLVSARGRERLEAEARRLVLPAHVWGDLSGRLLEFRSMIVRGELAAEESALGFLIEAAVMPTAGDAWVDARADIVDDIRSVAGFNRQRTMPSPVEQLIAPRPLPGDDLPTTTRGAVRITGPGPSTSIGITNEVYRAVVTAGREGHGAGAFALVGQPRMFDLLRQELGRYVDVTEPPTAFGVRIHLDERLPPDALWLVPANRVFPPGSRTEYAPSGLREAYRRMEMEPSWESYITHPRAFDADPPA